MSSSCPLVQFAKQQLLIDLRKLLIITTIKFDRSQSYFKVKWVLVNLNDFFIEQHFPVTPSVKLLIPALYSPWEVLNDSLTAIKYFFIRTIDDSWERVWSGWNNYYKVSCNVTHNRLPCRSQNPESEFIYWTISLSIKTKTSYIINPVHWCKNI